MKRMFAFFAVIAIVAPFHSVAAEPTVARAQFTSGILDREPVDQVSSLNNSMDRVFFFTELMDMEGKTIVHRWELNGTVMAAVTFDVRGPRWRVYSSKELLPEWSGAWVVSVVNEDGTSLGTYNLGYNGN